MKQKLINENLNLVYFVINKYYPYLIGDEDIIQAGMLGLCMAAKNFDESKAQFSTYASSCISAQIVQEIRNRKKHNGVFSLDYEYDTGEDIVTLSDVIEGENDLDVMEFTNISAFIDTLNERECAIFEMCKQGMTTTQIGKVIGLSQQRVSQILRTIRLKWRKYNGH